MPSHSAPLVGRHRASRWRVCSTACALAARAGGRLSSAAPHAIWSAERTDLLLRRRQVCVYVGDPSEDIMPVTERHEQIRGALKTPAKHGKAQR